MLAPVVLFAYKRDKHVKKVLTVLNKDKLAWQTDLIVFIDGCKNESDIPKVEAVKRVISEFQKENCFQKVIIYESNSNKGLANSIIDGVTKIINKYGKVIVLEDDLLVSSDFLQFMNDGLNYYENDKRVGAISGFCPKIKKKSAHGVYKARTGNSCGWATWDYVWNAVDWKMNDYEKFRNDSDRRKAFNQIQFGISDMLDCQMSGKLDSWAVRWDYYFFDQKLWTVYPGVSKVQNIGFDEEGTTSNNMADRRRKIMAEAAKYTFVSFDDLFDMTMWTARYYKPSIFEKIIDRLTAISKMEEGE